MCHLHWLALFSSVRILMTLVKIGGTARVLLLHAFLHCVLLHCIGWLFSPLMTLVKAEMPYWSECLSPVRVLPSNQQIKRQLSGRIIDKRRWRIAGKIITNLDLTFKEDFTSFTRLLQVESDIVSFKSSPTWTCLENQHSKKILRPSSDCSWVRYRVLQIVQIKSKDVK